MTYELLAIFPGTLDEAEVDTMAGQVKELIEKQGAAEVTVENMGKSRLAYPMKHIRYGYFRMYYFSVDVAAALLVQKKLNMSNLLLRAVMHRHNPKAGAKKLQQIMSDVAIAGALEDARKEARPAFAASTVRTVSRNVGAETPASSRTTGSVPLEDIDKKLDEILESDLTKV